MEIALLFAEKLTPPPLIAGVLLAQSSEAESFSRIARLERPPLPKYVLTRQLCDAVLAGQSFDWAINQAKKSLDSDQRPHAIEVLSAAKAFLLERGSTKTEDGPSTRWGPSGRLEFPIRCDAASGRSPDRKLLLFHFWKAELPESRLPLIKGALRSSLWQLPGYAGSEIELVTVGYAPALGRRNLKVIRCDQGQIAGEDELTRFGDRLASLWDRYHELHPVRRWN